MQKYNIKVVQKPPEFCKKKTHKRAFERKPFQKSTWWRENIGVIMDGAIEGGGGGRRRKRKRR